MPKWIAGTKAKTTNSGVEDIVMVMGMAKGNQVASVIQVVLSQEDLANTVEPSTHQSSALPSEHLAITTRKRSLLQILSHQSMFPVSTAQEEGHE